MYAEPTMPKTSVMPSTRRVSTIASLAVMCVTLDHLPLAGDA